MIDRSSALQSNYIIGKNPINNNIGLQFKRVKDPKITQIGFWPDTKINVELFLKEKLNLSSCAEPNKVIVDNKIVIMRIEPLKWWILGNDLELYPDKNFTTLELSHSFTQLQISGKSSELFLNRFLPLDLRKKSFPIDNVASSAIHHVSVKLWKSKSEYNLFIPRGFSLSIWEIFLETAKQFGYEIK